MGIFQAAPHRSTSRLSEFHDNSACLVAGPGVGVGLCDPIDALDPNNHRLERTTLCHLSRKAHMLDVFGCNARIKFLLARQ